MDSPGKHSLGEHFPNKQSCDSLPRTQALCIGADACNCYVVNLVVQSIA